MSKGTDISLGRASALVLFSCSLFALSFPGRPIGWLAWVSMVPLLYVLRRSNPLRGFILTGFFGWLIWFSSVWWLQFPLHDLAGMPRAAGFVFTMAGCFLLALPYALAGAIVCKLPQNRGVIGSARSAAIFTAAITFLTPVFQGSIAHTQYQYPVVFQVLDLGGVPLLLFFIFWINGLLADAVCFYWENRSHSMKTAGAAVALLGVILLYGVVRLNQFEMEMKTASPGRWFTVGAIQPNIPIAVTEERQPDSGSLKNNFFTAMDQAKELASQNPEIGLLAFPENPATFLFNQDTTRRQALGKLINETGKPVILNADAVDVSQSADGSPERYNVTVMMDANRNVAESYAKIKRIPFVEYVPWESRFPWLRKWFPKSQRVLKGRGPVVFELIPEIRVIPLVCYEGTISSFLRQFVEKGGNLVINQVNDSWFLRTEASEIHLALTLFRTVEYRVPLVRVTNSGIGAHIQADGQIVSGSRTDLFTSTARAFPLYVPMQRSVYARFGNLWMFGLLLFFLRFDGRRQLQKPR